jgi:predicted nuclease with TOPRIM domain
MFANNTIPSYATQTSNVSIESNDSDASSSTNVIQYGPIRVRLCRKSTLTLENGRRSKNLILVGDEAVKRQKRRERNRDAARKLKEKRQQIEEELNQQLKQLESEHANLQNYLQQLHQRKQSLQTAVDNIHIDPIIEFLSNDDLNMPLFLKQHLNDLDLFDESIEEIFNFY